MPNNAVLLVARILLSVIFVLSGFGKLADAGATAGMIEPVLPMPVAVAYLAGIVELVAGLAVLVGFQTVIAAWALAIFCVLAGVLFHTGSTGDPMMDMMNQISLMKNLAIAGGFLALSVSGPGSISVDARRA